MSPSATRSEPCGSSGRTHVPGLRIGRARVAFGKARAPLFALLLEDALQQATGSALPGLGRRARGARGWGVARAPARAAAARLAHFVEAHFADGVDVARIVLDDVAKIAHGARGPAHAFVELPAIPARVQMVGQLG